MPTYTRESLGRDSSGRQRYGGLERGTRQRTSSGGSQIVAAPIGTRDTGTASALQEQEAIDKINQERIDRGEPILVGTNPPPARPKPAEPTTVRTMAPPTSSAPLAPGTQGPLTREQYAAQQRTTVTSPLFNRPVTRAEIDAGRAASEARIAAAKQQARAEEQSAAYNQGFRTTAQQSRESFTKIERAEQKVSKVASYVTGGFGKPAEERGPVGRNIQKAVETPAQTPLFLGKTILSGGLVTKAALNKESRADLLGPEVGGKAPGLFVTDLKRTARDPDTYVQAAIGIGVAKATTPTRTVKTGTPVTQTKVFETKTIVKGRPDLTSTDIYGSFETRTPVTVTQRGFIDRLRGRPGTVVQGESTASGIISGRGVAQRTESGLLVDRGVEFDITGKQTTTIGKKTTTQPFEASGIGFRQEGAPVTAIRFGQEVSVTRRTRGGSYQAERVIGEAPGVRVTTPVTAEVSNLQTQTATVREARSRLFTPQARENLGLQTTRTTRSTEIKGFGNPKDITILEAQNLQGETVFKQEASTNYLANIRRTSDSNTVSVGGGRADLEGFYRTGFERLTGKQARGARTEFTLEKPAVKPSKPLFDSPLMKPENRLKKVGSKPVETPSGNGLVTERVTVKTRTRERAGIDIDTSIFQPKLKTRGVTVPRLVTGVAPRTTQPTTTRSDNTQSFITVPTYITQPKQAQKPFQLIVPAQRQEQQQRQAQAQVQTTVLRFKEPQKTQTSVVPVYGKTPRSPFAFGFPTLGGGGGVGGGYKQTSRSGGDVFDYSSDFTSNFFGIKASKKQAARIKADIAAGRKQSGPGILRPLL